jgi:hypothetical protein
MHIRLSLITADPLLLDDAIRYIEDEVRPLAESRPGNLGMSLQANPELGVAIVETSWASHEALRAKTGSWRRPAARWSDGPGAPSPSSAPGFRSLSRRDGWAARRAPA